MIYMLILLQAALPALLLSWLALKPLPSLVGRMVQILSTGLYVAALYVVGMWLMPPWWTAHLLAGAWIVAALASYRGSPSGACLPSSLWEGGAAVALAALGIYAGWLTIDGVAGRQPTVEVVDLAFPLGPGTYLVTSGGSAPSVNGHMRTLHPTTPRMAAHRGQSYAVDLVKINPTGLRAGGLHPRDPSRYLISGASVRAPCSGSIVAARGDLPDMGVPEKDLKHLTGNHVLIECKGVHVLLAHLMEGTVAVGLGDQVQAGAVIGTVGNSGNTDEPHLHIHAQRPGSASEPISGEPLQIRLGGRFLVRGDRHTAEVEP